MHNRALNIAIHNATVSENTALI